MKNLAIIPARSGSKGLKDKNIKLLANKPLIAYTINAAIKSGIFDEIMVSTDSDKYAEISKKYGANVPFLRSKEMSGDTATTWDTVKEVLSNYSKLGKEFETVCVLQPTSPLRKAEHILQGYKKFEEKNANFVVGVCEMDHSPLWSNMLPSDYSMENFIKDDVSKMPRQQIPTYYRINGALYIIKTDYLFKTTNYYQEKSYAVVMDKKYSIDIDDEVDFKIAEVFIKEFL